MKRIQNFAPEGFIALDNSALIFPPTEAVFNANTFRVSMDFSFTIKKTVLEQALHDLLHRCSYAKVRLHTGFFWYYLSPNDAEPIVHEEGSYPSGRFAFKENNEYLFKVIYSDHRIALECFHALTDGSGAMNYLKLLVERYCHHAGIQQVKFPSGLDYRVRPTKQEFSDPFQHLYDKHVSSYPTISKAYHRKGKGPFDDRVKVISATILTEQIKERAKVRSLTIGEYLSSVYLYSLQQLQIEEIPHQKRRKPIRLSVPMNLRRIFGYDTMRNFTLFAVVGIEPALGFYEFDEIATEVHLQMVQAQSRKRLLSQIKRNVSGERVPIIRFAPTALKNPLFKLLSDFLGDDQYSGVISNLGYVVLPPQLENQVVRCDFHLSPGLMNKISLSVIGYLDRIVVNFNSFYASDTSLERIFCTFLVEDGIQVEIATNREDTR
ncbi:MAG: hypothetical protein AB7S66_03885 [Sphaerochaeta sp.]|jgi:hypothetical protein|uniref:hypothetical protein n=1 Tax=Sphaerochaeta sp. TaxID=1972642 RepID=UPI003D0B8E75